MAHCSSVKEAGRLSPRSAVAGLAPVLCAALLAPLQVGCQSHLNSQLLERELRLQEDQIYRLQDVLDEKCARLESVVQENASLKRQLGYGGGEPTPSRGGAASSPRRPSGGASGGAPAFVPPSIELSDPAPPSVLPAPLLEGVPPLPQSSPGDGQGGGDAPPAVGLMPEGSLPVDDVAEPAGLDPDAPGMGLEDGPAFGAPQAAAPRLLDEPARQASAMDRLGSTRTTGAIQQLSYQEEAAIETVEVQAEPLLPPATDASIERIVINRSETTVVDADANGVAEALAVVFEPRDLEERLVGVAGDVLITVHEAAAQGPASTVATWSISAADAASTFRSTSRSRGLRFLLPWRNGPSAGFVGTLHVRLTSPDGRTLDAETPLSMP